MEPVVDLCRQKWAFFISLYFLSKEAGKRPFHIEFVLTDEAKNVENNKSLATF